MKQTGRMMSVIVVLCVWSGAVSCAGQSNQGDNATLAAGLLALSMMNNAIPSEYLPAANAAVNAWNIGLAPVQTAAGRSTFIGMYNPANYVTVTDDACTDSGIPADLAGANCAFKATNGKASSVIGVCQTRVYNGSNQIADSTVMIRKSFQASGASAVQRQAVWTHEIGHCLGLQHTQTATNIMYPYVVDSAPKPSQTELAAVQSAYVPIAPVSESVGSAFFSQSNGGYTRQYSLPAFFLAGRTNGGTQALTAVPEEMPLEGPVTVTNHFIHSDGTAEEVVVLN